MNPDLSSIAGNFQFEGKYVEALPYGSGHIHDTYAVWCQGRGSKPQPYLMQRINQHVFKDPEGLQQNIEKVTRHLQQKIAAKGGDPNRETLTIIPTLSGDNLHRDSQGNAWRAYIFIENAHSTDKAGSPEQVYQAARAYGTFQNLLADFPPGNLIETIPDFHNTPKRFRDLQVAVQCDSHHRALEVRDEIQFAEARSGEMSLLVDLLNHGELPQRITHNDTKLNNVLFDDQTGKAICVIDLDTVMSGTALFDFGDAVRSAAALSAEDEAQADQSRLSLEIFDHLVHGYLESAGDFLTSTELEHLVRSAHLMSLECGMRFLEDHLSGDSYFKISRTGQNLDRCRVQFKLVGDIEAHADEMQRIIDRYR